MLILYWLRLHRQLLPLACSLLVLRCGRGKVTHAAVALGLFPDARTADGFIEAEAANFTKLDPHAQAVFKRVAEVQRRTMLATFTQALLTTGLVEEASGGSQAEVTTTEQALALARLEHGIPTGKTAEGLATLYGFRKLADRFTTRLKSVRTAPAEVAPAAPATPQLAALAAATTTATPPLTTSPDPKLNPAWHTAALTTLPFGKYKGRQLTELLSDAVSYRHAERTGQVQGEHYLYWLARLTKAGYHRRGGLADYCYGGVNYSQLAREVINHRVEVQGWRATAKTETEAKAAATESLPDFMRPNQRKDALADFAPVFSRREEGLVEGDPIANEGTRRMLGGICSALTGKRRNIVFKEGAGFATDLAGTIYLDPYPLGKHKPLAANLAVMTAGLEHELGHELFTNPDHWRKVLEVAGSAEEAPVEGLDERGRQIISHIYNIIEDGRMEREVSLTYAGAAEHLALGCQLQPRWDETVGEGIDPQHQVYGAMLYTALPYFKVKPAVRAAMSKEARALFEELEPVVRRGVTGSSDEALEAAFTIARRLQKEGLTAPPPPKMDIRPPADPASSEYRHKDKDKGKAKEQGTEAANSASAGNGSGRKAGGQPGNQNARKEGEASGSDDQPPGSQSDHQAAATTSGRKPGAQIGNQNARKEGEGAVEEETDPTSQSAQAEKTKARAEEAPPKGEDESEVDRESDVSSFSNTFPKDQPVPTNESEHEAQRTNPSPKAGTGGGEALTPREIPPTDWEVSQEAMRKALDALENEAAYEVGQEVKRQAGITNLGRRLHKPLPSEGGREWEQHFYLDSKGRPTQAVVHLPYTSSIPKSVLDRRPAQKARGHELAKYLRRVTQQAEERLEMQSRGKLDRGRFVAAVKGARDVYTQTRTGQKKTALAVSINVDQSGSMGDFADSGQLLDAALTVGDAMQELSLPYEMRGFDDNTILYKTMGDKELDLHRAAYLTSAPGSCERIDLACGLAATSLAAREETNRLAIFMTDGQITGSSAGLANHQHAVNQMEAARKKGVIPFGVFFEGNIQAPQKELDQLYGKGGWVTITTLDQLPKVVGEKIANIFNRLK